MAAQRDNRLPPPLVSPEVDLRGFPGFMLNVERLLASELVALCTPEEGWAAVMLWARAWQQSPPASLPDDNRLLAAFSGAGKRWPKIRDMALRGFVKCSDGRLYHRVLAEEANEAWERRREHRDIQDNKNNRQKRWRKRLRELAQMLRARGITPPQGASLDILEALLREAEQKRDVDGPVDAYVDGHEIGKTETGTETRRLLPSQEEETSTGMALGRAGEDWGEDGPFGDGKVVAFGVGGRA